MRLGISDATAEAWSRMGEQVQARDPAVRFRRILREEGDTWFVSSLPAVFLLGLIFEFFLALRDQGTAELTLNVVTVFAALGWVVYVLVRSHRRRPDLFLMMGVLVLMVGAGGRLLEVYPALWPEMLAKTVGTLLLLLALDRSEKRRANRALRESSMFLESVFESIPDPLFILDRAGRVLEANQCARRAFGEDLIGIRCDRIDPDVSFAQGLRSVRKLSRASAEPCRDELLDIQGLRRYEVTTFVMSAHGSPSRLIQQWRNVRSQAEAEQSSDLLRDAVNSVQDPLLVLGLEGELLHCNRAAVELIGIDSVDAKPRSPEDLLPFEKDEDRGTFLIALRDWGDWQREVRMVGDSADAPRSFDLRLSPIRSAEERRLGSVVSVRDITEIKTLQSQLVQNEKLGSLGQLVSGVAHELNNPLTAVFGFAQVLLSEDLPQRTKDEVRHIYTHAERCKKIIDGLLRFARPNQGERTRSNLNEIVEGAVDLVRYPLQLASVKLELNLAERLPDSLMDPFLLQQVLINLLTNAQHAIEARGAEGRVRVRTAIDPASGSLILEVSDNGCGIPKSVESKIFDPFFTTKGVGKGTGLGLSLCYGIVRDHGGRMRVRSKVGQGTRFLIEFPVQIPPAEKVAPIPVGPVASAKGSPLRVLIVDDEAVILELLQSILQAEGHEVHWAEEGDVALELVGRKRFDVIFTDWRMPMMTGEELYEKIVKLDPRYRGRVIFTTGDVLDQQVALLAARDGNQLLNKPFAIEAVRERLAMVQRAVGRSGEADGRIVLPGAPATG